MKWEFLEVQELREGSDPGRGHVYKLAMWRTPVPGGWLVMAINTRSSDPQPTPSFYPDADHVWTGKTPEEAYYLLRAASAVTPPSISGLLRPVLEEDGGQKRLES